MNRKKIKTAELFQFVNLVTQLGLIMVGSILGAGFIGFLFDKLFGFSSCFIIIFGIVGIGGGFVSAYKIIVTSLDKHDSEGTE